MYFKLVCFGLAGGERDRTILMKKNDWILMIVILFISCMGLLAGKIILSRQGGYAVVSVDGKEYGTYSLNKKQAIDINGTNTLQIEEGEADMIEADCRDKLCVHQKAIQKKGETIICLPNKIVVEIQGNGTGNEVDSYVN